jgi:hypothetical protein
MAQLKVHVQMITKYVTMMENAQVHIIILNLNTITINVRNLFYYILPLTQYVP